METNIQTLPSLTPQLNEFLELYELQKVILNPKSKIKGLKLKKDRTCRFCGKNNNGTSFKKDSHIIPNLLGNRYLISDFECDNCNLFFSKFENDFANWLGISRSILGTYGKKGKIKFKSPDGIHSKAETLEFLMGKNNVLLSAKDSFINFDRITSKHSIEYKKHPFTPINVYKLLLKIAISILPIKEVSEYSVAIKNLLDPKNANYLNQFSQHIHCTTLPIIAEGEKLVCYLFKRKIELSNNLLHLFTINYNNIFLSFPIPFNLKDCQQGVYSKELNLTFPPPIFQSPQFIDHEIRTAMIDLSSTDITKNEFGYIEFQTPSIKNEDLYFFDPETGESGKAEFKPEEIRGMLIVDANLILSKEMLKKLSDKIID